MKKNKRQLAHKVLFFLFLCRRFYIIFFCCIYAIAGVSSPNCGDKVEVQLLFMVFLYLKKIEVLFDVYMNYIPTNNNQSHLKNNPTII